MELLVGVMKRGESGQKWDLFFTYLSMDRKGQKEPPVLAMIIVQVPPVLECLRRRLKKSG